MKTALPFEPSVSSLTIGKLAKSAGVGVETIRFYERQGLLPEPARRMSGYRSYGPDAVARLEFIRRAKDLGFTLNEIKSLLSLRRDPNSTAADVKREAQRKIQDVDEKIRNLQAIRRALQRLIDECHGRGPLSECPILDAMERGGHSKSSTS
jgi:MerR family transcriptional regulator, copper efflux regulator